MGMGWLKWSGVTTCIIISYCYTVEHDFLVHTVQYIECSDFAVIFVIFSTPHRDFADFFTVILIRPVHIGLM